MTKAFRLRFHCAPGDVVASTALVRDLAKTYPDFQIDMDTNQSELFRHNPYLTPLTGRTDVREVTLDYQPYIYGNEKGGVFHFVTAFHRDFQDQTGIPVSCSALKPDLHLPASLRDRRPIENPYWLMFAGGKRDTLVKHWDYTWYQVVVDELLRNDIHVAQSGAAKDIHPRLQNVLDIVGCGGLQELMWFIYHADGVICPITCAMHMAAAFDKPCVVIAGGREEPWWEAYSNDYRAPNDGMPPIHVPHRYLHTVGQLHCCLNRGCWKQLVSPDPRRPDDPICVYRNARPSGLQAMPECMARITPDKVVEAVLSYSPRRSLLRPVLNFDWKREPTKPAWKTRPNFGDRWSGRQLGDSITCVTLRGSPIIAELERTAPPNRLELLIKESGLPISLLIQASQHVHTKYIAWCGPRSYVAKEDWLDYLASLIVRQELPIGYFGNYSPLFLPSDSSGELLQSHLGYPATTRLQELNSRPYVDKLSPHFGVYSVEALRSIRDLPWQRDNAVFVGELLRQNGFRLKSLDVDLILGKEASHEHKAHVRST